MHIMKVDPSVQSINFTPNLWIWQVFGMQGTTYCQLSATACMLITLKFFITTLKLAITITYSIYSSTICHGQMTVTWNKLENAWQSLAYSPLGAEVSPPNEYLWKTLTYWSPECLTASSHREYRWTEGRNYYQLWPCKFFRLKLRRNYSESHQIFTICTEMIADWLTVIKIVIFQSVSERQYAKWTNIV